MGRVRKEAHADDGGKDNGNAQEDHGGLFEACRGLYPLLYARFAEGDGAGADGATIGTAIHKGVSVLPSLLGVKSGKHALVAGKLRIAAVKIICKPHKGIEPINAQQQISEGAENMVKAFYVHHFVAQNVLRIPKAGIGGKIDARTEKSENEGRADAVANIYPLRHVNCLSETAAEHYCAYRAVNYHTDRARKPDCRKHGGYYLQGIDAISRLGSKG